MILNLYEFIHSLGESAVNASNSLSVILLGAIISIAVGYITKTLTKLSFVSSLSTSGAVQIVLVIAFFAVKDNLQAERLKDINKLFNDVELETKDENITSTEVYTWRDGYNLIKRNPYELGYYLMTADRLIDDYSDYESAARLLELSLEFIKPESIPPDVCKRLRICYEHLDNRVHLNKDCEKEIIIL